MIMPHISSATPCLGPVGAASSVRKRVDTTLGLPLARRDHDGDLARDRDGLLHDLVLALTDNMRHYAPLLSGCACRWCARGAVTPMIGLAERRRGRGDDDVAYERELAPTVEPWGNGWG